MRLLALLGVLPVVVLLTGCFDPTFPFARQHEQDRADVAPPPVAVPPTYDLTVLVTQETADGSPLAGAEVVAFVMDARGEELTGVSIPASTNGQGVARFSFSQPVRLALRATLPGWTQEGTTVAVAEEVVVGDGLVASDRDVFLPLYRSSLRLDAGMVLSTATVAPDGMGNLVKPQATVDLVLPDRAAAAYLDRLTSADVQLTWTETATERADLSAGLAWDGRLWAVGEPAGPGVVPGGRSATFSGAVPDGGMPADLDAATLQAAAVTNTAVVGDVPLAVEVELRFDGNVPAGLPSACHAMVCSPIPPV